MVKGMEDFRELFNSMKCGDIDLHRGKKFMKITGMVAENLYTGRRYFLGLDF